MTWEKRARDLFLAGGALALGACTTGNSAGGPNVPCGNANPDPCICGRPDADVYEANLCDEEKACQAHGGSWTYGGGCVTEGGAPLDASSDAPGDAADGSATDAAGDSAIDAATDSTADAPTDSAADGAGDSAADAGETDAADAGD